MNANASVGAHARAGLAVFILLGLVLAWAGPSGLAPVRSGEPSFDELLVAGLTLLALAGYAWLVLAALATALSASRFAVARLAARVARRMAPQAWRQTVLLACGAAVAVLPATAATSMTGSGAGDPEVGRTSARSGVPLPDRPVARLGTSPPVVVRPGDSLWAIAERELGPTASDSDVAARWPQWYRANRTLVGPDPDLIFPGTLLQPPTEQPYRPRR